MAEVSGTTDDGRRTTGFPSSVVGRRSSVVGPLLLVSIGLLLLFNNLGLVPWSIWRVIWPFWPVVFILLGVEALVTGRLSWGWLLLTLVLVGIGSVAGSAVGAFVDRPGVSSPPSGPARSQFRQPPEGATRALVRVEYGGGAVRIGPLDHDQVLAEGGLYGQGSGTLETRYRVRDGVGELSVEAGGGRGFFWGRRGEPATLDLRLNRSLPTELRVEAGAADLSLDLRDLQVGELRVETGASRGNIVLPATGQTRARVEGGATALTIQVPTGVAARIVVDGGLSDVRIDETRFPRQGREYRSPDYDTAANRVDLSISAGAARVEVQ